MGDSPAGHAQRTPTHEAQADFPESGPRATRQPRTDEVMHPLKRWLNERTSRRLRARASGGYPRARATLSPAAPGLTWRCDVCGNVRPDDRIDVYQRLTQHPSGVTLTENIKYCNDRKDCTEDAPHVRFVPRDIFDDEGEVAIRGDG